MNFYQTNINCIISTLYQNGLRHAIICPGSRNAPLIMAFSRFKKIKCTSIVDERSAAFVALGMAKQLQEPVAIICTSGSAVVNLYPAITEAYYMQIPLLVITADRPSELMDRWDGQMIRQFDVFKSHTKGSFQTPENISINCFEDIHLITSKFYKSANTANKGPAHLNVPLKEPLYTAVLEEFEYPVYIQTEKTAIFESSFGLPKFNFETNTKVLILCGANEGKIEHSNLEVISNNKYAMVIADVISNYHSVQNIENWEGVLLNLNEAQRKEFVPDLLITTGKMVLNKTLKTLLRNNKPRHHWHISDNGFFADMFFNNPQIIVANKDSFFSKLSQILPQEESHYYSKLRNLALVQLNKSHEVLNQNFNEFLAVKKVLETLPENIILHLANSMTLRYVAYLCNVLKNTWQINCNRGVSGIDGCTSTALGAALVNTQLHVLITGDIAFFYDINALWQQNLPTNFKIVILNNFGGNIFKIIEGPSQMSELNPFLETPHSQNAELLAQHFKVGYFKVSTLETLDKTINQWLSLNDTAILEIQTDSTINTKIFNQYKNITL